MRAYGIYNPCKGWQHGENRMTVDTCKHVLAWVCVHCTILTSQSFIHVSHVSNAQPKGFHCVQWHKDIVTAVPGELG